MELGAWFDAEGKYACAVEEYEAASKLEPHSGDIFLRRGTSLLRAGNPTEAEPVLREAISLLPSSPEPHEKLAELLEASDRRADAQAEWDAALNLSPKSIPALHGAANNLIVEGSYPAAIRLLRAAPKSETLTLDLAHAYAAAGSLADTEKVLRKAVSENPSSFPLTRALVGVLVDEHIFERTFEEPVNIAERFAAEHPSNVDAQRLYLQMLVAWIPQGAQTGDVARVTPLARKLLAAHPNDAYFLYANGMLERQAGNYKDAKAHLEKSAELDPKDDRVHYELGMVLAATNEFGDAKREFERTLALGNTRPEVRFQLAKVLRALGMPEEADKELKLYRDQMAAASEQRISKLKEAEADKALSSGQTTEAIALLRQAIDATPEDAQLQFKLGMALDKTNDITGERAALEKAVQLDPDIAVAQNQLGYLASRSGDMGSAEEHFRHAVQVAPAYTEAWINLAATLGMEAKIGEARKAVAEALKVDPKNTAAIELEQDLKAAQR